MRLGSAKRVRELGARAVLTCFRINRQGHLVLADDRVRLDGLVQARRFKLLAGDAREDHAVAPGEGQLALVRT